MYRHGHIGVGLSLYAPVAYGLLSSGRTVLAAVGFVTMVWLAMIPDFDTKTGLLTHRGATHTLAFAVVFGAVCGVIGWLLGTRLVRFSPRMLAGFAFGLGMLAVLSHLLADWLTPMGIAPFWPVSSRRYSLNLARASNTAANSLLFFLGLGATVGALWFAGSIG